MAAFNRSHSLTSQACQERSRLVPPYAYNHANVLLFRVFG